MLNAKNSDDIEGWKSHISDYNYYKQWTVQVVVQDYMSISSRSWLGLQKQLPLAKAALNRFHSLNAKPRQSVRLLMWLKNHIELECSKADWLTNWLTHALCACIQASALATVPKLATTEGQHKTAPLDALQLKSERFAQNLKEWEQGAIMHSYVRRLV